MYSQFMMHGQKNIKLNPRSVDYCSTYVYVVFPLTFQFELPQPPIY